MKLNKIASAAVIAVTLVGTTAALVSPAAAWCDRWGRCWGGYGGYGVGGAVAAGVVAGTALGLAAASAAAPRPYYYAAGGYWACPPGYHLGRYRRACWAN